jgi:hypothetical protein
MALTPAERRIRSRMGAYALHKTISDEVKFTAPARQAFLNRFEREVDPDGRLDPVERARLAGHARREHMQRLAMASVRSSAARKRKADGIGRGSADG